MQISEQEKHCLFSIVEQILTECVQKKKELTELTFSSLPNPQLQEKCGAFVTYHKKQNGTKELRGCIGLIEGIYPLWETVARMAYSAAFHDSRFMPIEAEELPFIEYEITVLTPSYPCNNIDEIILGKHGIILELNSYRSVFLPQVPTEQGWTKEETLEFLSMKAGLPKNAWQNPQTTFSLFEGIVLEK